MAVESKLKVVYRKYLNPERQAVALLPPAKTLLDAAAVRTTAVVFKLNSQRLE
ncbi:hypothetical protein L1049_003540 [Liquidambar formosana]|uniref:Uncharacterized protein n=1 Tax=Liquidambar formosana TaxID=63359 RepID=A0AAP0N4Q7_LIQFO